MTDINIVMDPNRLTNLYPGNKHHFSAKRHRAVSADMMRIAMTLIVPAEPSEERTQLETLLAPAHLRPGRPYGVGLVESQQHSVMLITGPEEIEQFQAGRGRLHLGEGSTVYAGWPTAFGQWENLLPPTTWHPGGWGILGQYAGEGDAAGARVTLYEYTIDRARAYNDRAAPVGEMMNMVTWHCDRCHTPDFVDLSERHENTGPNDREWLVPAARRHAAGRDGKCKLPTGEMERVVSAVASKIHGREIRLPSRAAACRTDGPCAQIQTAVAAGARLALATESRG